MGYRDAQGELRTAQVVLTDAAELAVIGTYSPTRNNPRPRPMARVIQADGESFPEVRWS